VGYEAHAPLGFLTTFSFPISAGWGLAACTWSLSRGSQWPNTPLHCPCTSASQWCYTGRSRVTRHTSTDNQEVSNQSASATVQEHQAGTTEFLDDAAITSAVAIEPLAASDLGRPMETGVRQDALAAFLEKPLQLATGTWSTGTAAGGNLLTLSLPQDLFAEAIYSNKTQGNLFARWKEIEILIEVNAPKFAQGRMLAHFIPLGNAPGMEAKIANTAAITSMYNRNLQQKTLHPRVELAATCDTAAKFTIPYCSTGPWYCLPTEENPVGYLFLDVYSPLKVGSGVTSVDYIVWARVVGCEFSTPYIANGPGSDEAPDRKISSTLKASSVAANALATIPSLTAIMKPAGWALGVLGGVASAFGYSKPTDEKPATKMIGEMVPSFTNCDGVDAGVNMGLSVSNSVTLPAGAFGTDEDDMNIRSLGRRMCFSQSINWGAATTGNILTEKMSPDAQLSRSGAIFDGGPAGMLSLFFEYWRCESMIVKLKFVKTEFHSGRVVFTYNPMGNLVAGTSNTTGAYVVREVIDVREANEYTFKLPFVAAKQWLRTPAPNSLGGTTEGVIGENCGTFGLDVVLKLRAPDTVSPDIDILIEYGFEGLEFAVPRPMTDQKNTNTAATIGLPYWSNGWNGCAQSHVVTSAADLEVALYTNSSGTSERVPPIQWRLMTRLTNDTQTTFTGVSVYAAPALDSNYTLWWGANDVNFDNTTVPLLLFKGKHGTSTTQENFVVTGESGDFILPDGWSIYFAGEQQPTTDLQWLIMGVPRTTSALPYYANSVLPYWGSHVSATFSGTTQATELYHNNTATAVRVAPISLSASFWREGSRARGVAGVFMVPSGASTPNLSVSGNWTYSDDTSVLPVAMLSLGGSFGDSSDVTENSSDSNSVNGSDVILQSGAKLYLCVYFDHSPTYYHGDVSIRQQSSLPYHSNGPCDDVESSGAMTISRSDIVAAEACTGESILSILQLMKRFTKLFFTTATFGTYEDTINSKSLTIRPFAQCIEKTGGSANTLMFGDYYSFFAPWFIFRTGSRRIKAVMRTEHDTVRAFYWPNRDVAGDSIEAPVVQSAFTNNNTRELAALTATTIQGWPAKNNQTEVTLPAYPQRHVMLNRPSWFDGSTNYEPVDDGYGSPMYLELQTTSGGATEVPLTLYGSVGDDFLLGKFIGTVPIAFN